VQAKRLGRGMDALLADAAFEQTAELDTRQLVQDLLLAEIEPNPDQPRKDFDEASLQELAESIREKGVIQPIIVQAIGSGRYVIIAGERRFRACKIAKLDKIPALVREYNAEDKLEVALIENIQRENLNPVEEAMAFRHLIDAFGLNQDELAKKVGKNRSTVANSLRLLKLPSQVLASLSNASLSPGHARAILSIPEELQEEFFALIQERNLSVRESERLARQVQESGMLAVQNSAEQSLIIEKKSEVIHNEEHESTSVTQNADNTMDREKSSTALETSIEPRPVELLAIEEKLRFALGTKIQVRGTVHQGKIEVSYFSMDDLDRVVGLLAGE
jgi:ParB family chromosome partitioning protein